VGIAPLELRKLKRASVALDLAFLRKDFVKAAEKGLGFLRELVDEFDLASPLDDKGVGTTAARMLMAYKREFGQL